MSKNGLVFVGKIVKLEPIEGADFIVSSTVVCGEGRKWRGIVRKVDFKVDDECFVFLPDSQLNEVIHAHMPFMKDTDWRVRMRRFKGSPSEVVITKCQPNIKFYCVGDDVTEQMGVTKYFNPIPESLVGCAKGLFPSFIPKTDEPNYQSSADLVDILVGKPYYVTEKYDGSSTTAFKYKGQFGVCSRNLELERSDINGYWKISKKYVLEDKLPDGMALQWETCGPGIQGNPMGLSEVGGFAFSAYNIEEHRYLEAHELVELCKELQFPMCKILDWSESFEKYGVDLLGEGNYSQGGKCREGVVLRSQKNILGSKPISFKVINLSYKN